MMNMIMTTAIATLYYDGFYDNNNCGDNDNNSIVNDKITAKTPTTIVTASA